VLCNSDGNWDKKLLYSGVLIEMQIDSILLMAEKPGFYFRNLSGLQRTFTTRYVLLEKRLTTWFLAYQNGISRVYLHPSKEAL
jgi:hypothetical protein